MMKTQGIASTPDELQRESLVIEMAKDLYSPLFEPLNSSQYFHYLDVGKEIEKKEQLLKAIFPKYRFYIKSQPNVGGLIKTQNKTKVDEKMDNLSREIREANEKNRKSAERVQREITDVYDSMRISEFRKLKDSLNWTDNEKLVGAQRTRDLIFETLFNSYYGALIQRLKSSTSSLFDFEFQEKCEKSAREKTDSVYTALTKASSLAQEYFQNMKKELKENVHSDFLELHRTVFVCSYNKVSGGLPAQNFQTVWFPLDSLTKFVLEECENLIRVEHLRLRKELAEAEKKTKIPA